MPHPHKLAADLDTVLDEAATMAAEWERVERPTPLPHRLIARALALPVAAFALLVASAALVTMIGSEAAIVGFLMVIGAVGFGLEVPAAESDAVSWLRSRLRTFDRSLLPSERADWREVTADPPATGTIIGTAFGEGVVALLRTIDAVALLIVPAGALAAASAAGALGFVVVVVPLIAAVVRLQRVARGSLSRTLLPRAALLLVVRLEAIEAAISASTTERS
jgi:hypothetical protein